MNVTVFILTILVFIQPQDDFDVIGKVIQPVGMENRIHSTEQECVEYWNARSDAFVDSLVKIEGVIAMTPACTEVEVHLEGGKSS